MTIYNLPTDLIDDTSQPIQLTNYAVQTPCLKNRIHLTYHVITFLEEGSKQLITENHSISIDPSQFYNHQGRQLLNERKTGSE